MPGSAALPWFVDAVVSLLLVAGGLFALVGAIGLVRLRTLLMRIHAPTKASTLGVGGALLASMLYFGWTGQRLVIHELLITAFVFLTAPIAAHLLVKAALERDRPAGPGAAAPTTGSESADGDARPPRERATGTDR